MMSPALCFVLPAGGEGGIRFLSNPIG